MHKQLWILAGGNGAGKSTFFRMFLGPRGIRLVNADLLAKEIDPHDPEKVSYQAANWVGRLLSDLLNDGISFCFETVFSHESKIDFVARAKASGYKIVLVYIHLATPELNEARVRQRVSEGGHNVPPEKIHSRIPRTLKNMAAVLPLVDEARLLDNSLRDDPFRQVAVVRHGRKGRQVEVFDKLPGWAEEIVNG